MRLIVIREVGDGGAGVDRGLLRYALSTEPLAGVIEAGVRRVRNPEDRTDPTKWLGGARSDDSLWAIPQDWQTVLRADFGPTLFYGDSIDIDSQDLEAGRAPWVMISDGRFVTQLNGRLLERFFANTAADVVAVAASPELLAYGEQVRLTPDNQLVGYRRLYTDSMTPMPLPIDWPHHLFVRPKALGPILDGGLLSSFGTLVEKCRAQGFKVQGLAAAGSAFDLESGDGLLALCRMVLGRSRHLGAGLPSANERGLPPCPGDPDVSPRSRLVGPVLLGKRVVIEPEVVVVGPSVLCNDSRVHQGAVVDSSIVGGGMSVEANQVLRSRIMVTPELCPAKGRTTLAWRDDTKPECTDMPRREVFRAWPRLSYAGSFKRIADIIVATIVLVLFAPVIPFIALAVKINSSGPVFFKDRRQGLHGRSFDCIKFRTMRAGSDKIQEKLRFVSEVDGPQFKMADDPRITAVGHFLRETYLDEIPQFFNVLCGQMSVVGPRPSPESENTLCPVWRDARLSVRPGITGLWQTCRTREPLKDFQEWIHYDTQYVRELSPRLDLWICWRTFIKMLSSFAHQF